MSLVERSGTEIIARLRSMHEVELERFISSYVARLTSDPFKVLIATILSQNSTDRVAFEAFRKLNDSIGVSPSRLARADLRRIRSAIRSAGLYRQKARTIKEVSRIVQRDFSGDLSRLLRGGVVDPRRYLTSIKGIGPKTADVVLVTTGMSQTVPVDTHIFRISKRLGISEEGDGYEDVRSRLDSLFPPHLRHEAHLLLITHGRRVCKPINPHCHTCSLSSLCKYYQTKRGRYIRYMRSEEERSLDCGL
ncbi:MAG: endonuclease III [Aigarchaeota archaeon]|nr:endonuclease III [Aigarchaeota archaeon]MDW8092155.1 endonuclease III [Nitrososphaerota archaeon]